MTKPFAKPTPFLAVPVAERAHNCGAHAICHLRDMSAFLPMIVFYLAYKQYYSCICVFKVEDLG